MESEAKTNMEQRATNPLEVISLSPSIHPFTYLLGLRRLGDGAARVVVILRSARGMVWYGMVWYGMVWYSMVW